MIDVTEKADTIREAGAKARVRLTPEIAQAILDSSLPKGDPLQTARIAGILAAKNTSQILPLCHPLPLTSVQVDLQLRADLAIVDISSHVKTVGKTGVEMEALTAVSVAALTIYDMCKSLSHDMTVSDIHLEYKSGGKSGSLRPPSAPARRARRGDSQTQRPAD
jgi:cyclic pyranopterin phosphate synthase